jgi:hypothetical protein
MKDELESPLLALLIYIRGTARHRSTYVLFMVSVGQLTVFGGWRLGVRGHWLFNNKGSMSDKGSEGKQESV